MNRYSVFYRKSPTFLPNEKLTVANLDQTHLHLKDLEAQDLEDVFYQMQGEIWSPQGEARELIRSKGLSHTSMSVGDVVYRHSDDVYYQVDFLGFRVVSK